MEKKVEAAIAEQANEVRKICEKKICPTILTPIIVFFCVWLEIGIMFWGTEHE